MVRGSKGEDGAAAKHASDVVPSLRYARSFFARRVSITTARRLSSNVANSCFSALSATVEESEERHVHNTHQPKIASQRNLQQG